VATHGIAVIVLAEYLPKDLLTHAKCASGLFTPITSDGALLDPVQALSGAEAPRQLFSAISSDHQHLAFWDEPLSLHPQVQCVGVERFRVSDASTLPCRHSLTLHLMSESAQAMEKLLSILAHVHTQRARALLAKLPFRIAPNLLVQRRRGLVCNRGSRTASENGSRYRRHCSSEHNFICLIRRTPRREALEGRHLTMDFHNSKETQNVPT